MPKRELELAEFQPHVDESRFSYWGMLISGIEYCYTESELDFWEDIIKLRASSGIPQSYLSNQLNWYNSDFSTAYVRINLDSWIFRPSFKPRDRLTKDDFRWHSVDPKSLQCPVNSIGKFIGDYLKIRNRNLLDEHINQPMNFVLIDVLHMLNFMAKDSNHDQVKTGLHALQRYLNQVKMKLPSIKGNDRHFISQLSNQKISQMIELLDLSKETLIFRDMVENLEQTIDYIDLVIQTKIHFSLNSAKINEHVYLLDEIQKEEKSAEQFPMMALKNCFQQKHASVSQIVDASNHQEHSFDVDLSILDNCSELELIEGLRDDDRQVYLELYTKIARISEIKKIIKALKSTLDTTGEMMLAFHFAKPVQSFTQQLGFYLNDLHSLTKKLDKAQGKYFFINSQKIQNIEQGNWFNQWVQAKKKEKLEQYNQNSKALEGSLFHLQNIDELISEAHDIANKINFSLSDLSSRDVPALAEDVENLHQNLLAGLMTFQGSDKMKNFQDVMIDYNHHSTPLQRLSNTIEKEGQLEAVCEPTGQSQIAYCKIDKYNAFLLQKSEKSSHPVSIPAESTQEHYEFEKCYSVKYENNPAIICDGVKSVAVFSESSITVDSLFSALPGQLAFAYLIGHFLKRFHANFLCSDSTLSEPKYKLSETRLEQLKDKLAEAYVCVQQADEMTDDSDLLEFFNEMIEAMAKTPFSKKEQDELEKDLDYFLDCTRIDTRKNTATGIFEVPIKGWQPGFFVSEGKQKNIHQNMNTLQFKNA